MRIFEQVPANQIFKETFLHTRFDRLERSFKGERLERIAVIQPTGQRAQHQRQPARKRAGVVLAQTKLNGVQRRLDGLRIDAVVRQFLERVENQRLDFFGIGDGNALQTGGKIHLAQFAFQAAGDILAEAGIDQRFVQGRRRGADQDVRENPQRQRVLAIPGFGEQPIDIHHAFFAEISLLAGVVFVRGF
ncbi:MAG: hypothetical protein ILNGONEN_01226 [Syntrophorhabdaceae bacterium]|nr:hypothetical protein [Syntrophorhabdaceae bacterium]